MALCIINTHLKALNLLQKSHCIAWHINFSLGRRERVKVLSAASVGMLEQNLGKKVGGK